MFVFRITHGKLNEESKVTYFKGVLYVYSGDGYVRIVGENGGENKLPLIIEYHNEAILVSPADDIEYEHARQSGKECIDMGADA